MSFCFKGHIFEALKIQLLVFLKGLRKILGGYSVF